MQSYDFLDKRYQSVKELIQAAELVPRNVFVARCGDFKLPVNPDHLTKTGLVKLLALEQALPAETKTDDSKFKECLSLQDLTEEGVSAIGNRTDSWLLARLQPIKWTAATPLIEVQKRKEITESFVRCCAEVAQRIGCAEVAQRIAPIPALTATASATARSIPTPTSAFAGTNEYNWIYAYNNTTNGGRTISGGNLFNTTSTALSQQGLPPRSQNAWIPRMHYGARGTLGTRGIYPPPPPAA